VRGAGHPSTGLAGGQPSVDHALCEAGEKLGLLRGDRPAGAVPQLDGAVDDLSPKTELVQDFGELLGGVVAPGSATEVAPLIVARPAQLLRARPGARERGPEKQGEPGGREHGLVGEPVVHAWAAGAIERPPFAHDEAARLEGGDVSAGGVLMHAGRPGELGQRRRSAFGEPSDDPQAYGVGD
jgi:hypothetical protein